MAFLRSFFNGSASDENSYIFGSGVKRFAKVALLFGTGVLGYLGWNVAIGGLKESSDENLAAEAKTDLALLDESFTTSRSLLSLEEVD